jgi:O-6-methylguanine DNA methyltransferase
MPFLDSATAQAAGYRACKQCRPDDSLPPARFAHAARLEVRYGVGPVPIGFAFVATTARGICAVYVLDGVDPGPGLGRLSGELPGAQLAFDASIATSIVPRISAHLTHGLPCDDLALDLRGTRFQLRVWEALRAIPWGETTTYGALAQSMGLPRGAARAVGTACGANPVSLIVPCHRVVRGSGALGGYYWGLDRKQVILDIERRGKESSMDATSVSVPPPGRVTPA